MKQARRAVKGRLKYQKITHKLAERGKRKLSLHGREKRDVGWQVK